MNKTVLITGASSGIGRELAKCFAMEKYRVILLARRKEKLEEVRKDLIEKYQVDCEYIPYDVKGIEHLDKIMKWTEIDVLVNCAGIASLGDFEELSWEEEVDMLQVNSTAPIFLSKYFAKLHYKEADNKERSIINIVSTAALYLHPFLATYSASKVSFLYYSLALGEELRRKKSKLKVYTYCPGPTTTDLFSKEIQERFIKEKKYEMSAEEVAKEIMQTYFKQKKFTVIGTRNKMLMCFLRMLPMKIQLRWVGNFLAKGKKESKKD